MTESLRATATVAFLVPILLAGRVPQAFSADQRGTRWRMIPAASSWERRVMPNGVVDRRAWTLCLIDRLRGALRRRDVFAAPSLRFADPRIGLLDGAAWDAARPSVCRTLGKSPNGAEKIERLTLRLDQAFRSVAANLSTEERQRPDRAGGRRDRLGADWAGTDRGAGQPDRPA
jgi:hypothetical protein